MFGDITAVDEIYIVTGRTDMRKSIDGLCAIVEDQLHMDPRRSALYLFCGKRDYEEKSVNKIFYDNARRKTGIKSAFRLCFIYNDYKIVNAK